MAAPLILDEDEQDLRDAAREVVEGSATISRLRARRDAGTRNDPALWEQLVELGWAGIPFPASVEGGLGMGPMGVAVVMEALGRELAETPMRSAVALSVLDPGGGAAEGRVEALAWRERARRPRPLHPETRFDGQTVSGCKRDVVDGQLAGSFLVTARGPDGLVIVRVRAEDAGRTARTRMDHRDVVDLHLDAAPATRLDRTADDLARALRLDRLAAAAEALGGLDRVREITVGYAQERVQFGRPIGAFQALQHRLVDLFVHAELARSAVLQAARDPSEAWVGLAERKVSETYLAAAKEAVQLHGGIGMTDECDVGFHLKRAMVYAVEVDALGR